MNRDKGENEKQAGFQALFEELKNRIGEEQAGEIVERIAAAWYGEGGIDYMTIKACSEIVELFRGDAKALLADLRGVPQWPDERVIVLEKRRLETEFRHIFRLYWFAMKLFYPMYDRAIAEFERKRAWPSAPSSTASRIAA